METQEQNQESIVRKIEKLLRLASNNPNEAEAASATEKVQELLATYNLDMLTIERKSPASNTRQDAKLKGGLYKWQRSLWRGVAELNFCMYWSIKGLEKGSQYEHRVLGRKVNVISTRLMAEYLEQAIERLAREWAGDAAQYFTKAAIAYREGMAARIEERVRRRRYEIQREQEAKKQADANCRDLTLRDVADTEYDENMEYLYPGWVQRKREREERERLEREKKAKWELVHPEEVARLKAEEEEHQRIWREEYEKKEARNAKRRKGNSNYYKGWEPRHEAYYEGYKKGDEVSLDQQIDANKPLIKGR